VRRELRWLAPEIGLVAKGIDLSDELRRKYEHGAILSFSLREPTQTCSESA
jgi:hypothetical protein